MNDDDMIEMGAMMDDLEEGIAEKDALLATQAAQIEVLREAMIDAYGYVLNARDRAVDGDKASSANDTLQKMSAALSNTGKK